MHIHVTDPRLPARRRLNVSLRDPVYTRLLGVSREHALAAGTVARLAIERGLPAVERSFGVSAALDELEDADS